MSNEMELAGIRFEVQWKRRLGVVGRKEDVTSIGLWDPDDSALDWKTFKTYLVKLSNHEENLLEGSIVCQNIGTRSDISVAYVDSDGDELPIESECEFQEALKFARERARKGRETLLKVDRLIPSSSAPSLPASKPSVVFPKAMSQRFERTKHMKISSKGLHKSYGVTDVRLGSEERKFKLKKHVACGDNKPLDKEKLNLSKLKEDLTPKTSNLLTSRSLASVETEEMAPQWFKKYMQKLKTELVNEVTGRVLVGVQDLLDHQAGIIPAADKNGTGQPATSRKKKKKVSDEDSSDGALGSDSRDQKLLKKIEKLHKREKRLEKKLDSKLEKLENKTKRMMEKKSQSKARCERAPEKKSGSIARKKSSDVLTGTYLMDAVLLNDSPKTELHIQPGQRFSKIWEIMNTGTLPWTDKTELRQAWGTIGLEPEETVLKCPMLEPGEKGLLAVNFKAPEYPGTFESYWHFYHMGDRFGHWIGCAVVVESKEESLEKEDIVQNEEAACENKCRNEDPVDLTVKSKPEQGPNLIHPALPVTNAEKEDDVSSTAVNKIEEKLETEPMICKPKDPEYDSDSDSDNLSVISGTVSLSSDSDEDENFVVVQMPACFLCDVPLGTVDTVPVVMKESKRKDLNGDLHPVLMKPSNNNIQLSNELQELQYNSDHFYNRLFDDENEPQAHRTVTITESNDMVIKVFNEEEVKPFHSVCCNCEGDVIPERRVSNEQLSVRTVTLTDSNDLFIEVTNDQEPRFDFRSVKGPRDIEWRVSSECLSGHNVTVTDSKDLLLEASNDQEPRFDFRSVQSSQDIERRVSSERLSCSNMTATDSKDILLEASIDKEPQFRSEHSIGKTAEETERKASNEQLSVHTVAVKNSNDLFIKFSNDKINPDNKVGETEEAQGRVFAVDMDGHCTLESLEPESVEFRDFPIDKVYAVDMAGHCMAVEPQHYGGPSTNMRTPGSETTGHTVTSSSSSSSASSTTRGSNNDAPSQQPNESNARPPPPPVHDPLGNVIHILPETLVSGAVNVATSAFSTARAVISNLRSKPPGDYGDWSWKVDGRTGEISPADRSTSENLKLLVEMGFKNKVLNVLLLQRYNNDVTKVVGELLAYEEPGVNGKGKDI